MNDAEFEELRNRLVRVERNMEILRDCLRSVEPLVVEYYSRKQSEGVVGYA